MIHYQPGEAPPWPLEITYDVLEQAPVLLTSRLGTEHWRLYHFAAETMSALYTDEKINLAQCGRQTAKATKAHFGKSYGPLPDSGLVGIRGHYYFLIDQPNGQWLDVTDPPAFFDQPEPAQRLTVTLADVTRYQLSIPTIQSTWKPGGPFRVRLVVTDASGKTHPVVNAPLVATCGDWRAALTTTWTPLNEPTGWMSGTLPATLPQELAVTGSVTVATPTGLQQREVSARFPRGAGLVEADELQIAAQGYKLPRNAAGVVRETRGIWVSTSDIASAAGIDELVDRCRSAGLNTANASRQAQEPPSQTPCQAACEGRVVVRVLEERLRHHQRVLGIVTDHAASEQKPMTPGAGEETLTPARQKALGGQAHGVADCRPQQHPRQPVLKRVASYLLRFCHGDRLLQRAEVHFAIACVSHCSFMPSLFIQGPGPLLNRKRFPFPRLPLLHRPTRASLLIVQPDVHCQRGQSGGLWVAFHFLFQVLVDVLREEPGDQSCIEPVGLGKQPANVSGLHRRRRIRLHLLIEPSSRVRRGGVAGFGDDEHLVRRAWCASASHPAGSVCGVNPRMCG